MKRNHSLALVAITCAIGCHKPTADAAQTGDAAPATSADMAAASAPPDPGAPVEIAPPAALVSADPSIPLNEAVVGAPALPVDYAADTAPPAPVVEDEPARPDPEESWVPGYWWWSRPLARYVWVSGAWRRPPPDQVWVGGSWGPSGGRYTWTPGYWGPRGYVREMIDVGPPPIIVETQGIAPGAGFAWTPGYYAHRDGRYAWTAGTWVRPPTVGVAWVEPRYVNSGGRFYLQPGRWDVPPERRGVVYRPDINVRPGAHVVLAVVPPTVVVEHAHFVVESAHAVARGATRTATGGFVIARPPVVDVHAEVHPNEVHPGVVVTEHEHVAEHVEPGHEQVVVHEHATVPEVKAVVEEHHATANAHVAVETPHVQATVETHHPVEHTATAPIHTATSTAKPPEHKR